MWIKFILYFARGWSWFGTTRERARFAARASGSDAGSALIREHKLAPSLPRTRRLQAPPVDFVARRRPLPRRPKRVWQRFGCGSWALVTRSSQHWCHQFTKAVLLMDFFRLTRRRERMNQTGWRETGSKASICVASSPKEKMHSRNSTFPSSPPRRRCTSPAAL